MTMKDARAIAEAVEKFAETWGELAGSLVDHYACHMTCDEADTLSELFRLTGRIECADYLIERHAAMEEEPETCRHCS